MVRLKEAFGLKSDITLELLVSAGGIIKPAEVEKDWKPIGK
jgi:hypothetical protein